MTLAKLPAYPRLTLLAAGVWTLLVGGSLVWNLSHEKRQMMELAFAEARTNLNKDSTFQRWGTRHGGVYVPLTEAQKPVPWLAHVPGRDVTTTDGRALTLLNPASMMRQIMEDYAEHYGIHARLVGLKYLNPGNAPDTWERQQLEAFTRGEKTETWTFADVDGQPQLRYLRAVFMEPGCDKCHAILGYKTGDMRGGIGVNLPLAPYYARIDNAFATMGTSHALIWLLGLAGIGWGNRMARRRDEEHEAREAERERSQLYLNTMRTIMVALDTQGCITMINPFGCALLGYAADELQGKNWFTTCLPQPEGETIVRRYFERLIRGEAQDQEYFENALQTATGKLVLVAWHNAVLFDDSGQAIGTLSAGEDITQRRAAEEEVHSLAFFDPLTGLPNRRLLIDRLQHSMAASARSGRYRALFFLDLDCFKNLNDTLGHEIGDHLLSETARRLRACVREGDTVARHGGDEFVVLLEQLSEDRDEAATQAGAVGEKIVAAVSEPCDLGKGGLYRGTTSVGVALFLGQEVSVADILKRADLAMYQAKAAGRNTLRFFDPAMQSTITARAELENELRRAVTANEFVLHYQPQVDPAGTCVGVEALIRWNNPQRGLVPPQEFIPLAEETGLILPIGQWVLREACARLAQWQRDPATAYLSIAVNVSARQFREPDFVAGVVVALETSGARAERLKLEITESMLLDNVEEIIAKMAALKAIGVSFSLDDFGTGYSSLSYVKRLPLDQLKIDQSFVRDVLVSPHDSAIRRAIIALGTSLGLSTIAEGVETEEQWQSLAAESCGGAQGYLYARPMPWSELVDWLERQR